MGAYFTEVHGKILDAWQKCFSIYIDTLHKYNHQLSRIDSDSDTIIDSDYLLDFHERMNKAENNYKIVGKESDDFIIKYRQYLMNLWRTPNADDIIKAINDSSTKAKTQVEAMESLDANFRNAYEEVERLLDIIEAACKCETLKSASITGYKRGDVNGLDWAKELAILGVGVDVLESGFLSLIDFSFIQDEKTWCGVASTLFVLAYLETFERESLISNFIRPSQSEIAEHVIPDGEDTAFVYVITKYINSLFNPDAIRYRDGDELADEWEGNMVTQYVSEVTVYNRIITSLSLNRPVILNCNPYKGLNYYSGSGYNDNHYVVVVAYCEETDTFTIFDPTYIENDPPYQGRHDGITIGEIYNSLLAQTKETGWMVYAE
jgi:hypothetical protein